LPSIEEALGTAGVARISGQSQAYGRAAAPSGVETKGRCKRHANELENPNPGLKFAFTKEEDRYGVTAQTIFQSETENANGL
jgi:hypothetical protein